MKPIFDDLTWRGLVYQVTDPELGSLLNRGGQTVYIGFDPTADSLHVGHLFMLANLRRLQIAGNRPIVLAGGATAMIGDPSFKSAERKLLDDETLVHNVESVRPQLMAFLDFDGPHAARIVNNADWTRPMDVISFLRDVGKHFTVNQLIARESVRARLVDRDQGISFTEFSYGLLQANDFLHLFQTHGCTVQMGGSDQWGNIVGGVDLIRRVTGNTAYGLVSPLITKADGTKFGKTESGTVWLDKRRTSPFALYQFFLRTSDADIELFMKYFSFRVREEITELLGRTAVNPKERIAQRALAHEMVALVHGNDAALDAEKTTEALYSESLRNLKGAALDAIAEQARSVTLGRSAIIGLPVVDALVRAGLCSSKTAARTAIDQGGVSVNNVKVTEQNAEITSEDVLAGRFVMLRRGKKEYAVLRCEESANTPESRLP